MLERQAAAASEPTPSQQTQEGLHAQQRQVQAMIQASQWQQLSQLQAQMKANGAWSAANASSTSSAPPIFTMPPLANWITSSHKGKGKGPKAPSATASSVASHAMSSVKLAKHQGTLPHMA